MKRSALKDYPIRNELGQVRLSAADERWVTDANAEVRVDYRNRVEPAKIIEVLKRLLSR